MMKKGLTPLFHVRSHPLPVKRQNGIFTKPWHSRLRHPAYIPCDVCHEASLSAPAQVPPWLQLFH